MKIKQSFNVFEREVKARDGAAYDLAKYREGVDYVARKAFKGLRVLFRSDILDEQVSDMSLTSDLESTKSQSSEHSEPQVEGEREYVAEHGSVPGDDSAKRDDDVADRAFIKALILRMHVNRRWAETDQGRVWVGMQNERLKNGMTIRVRNGQMIK